MEKWLYADITHFSQFYQYLKEQDTLPGFADDITDFISNVNCITRNATLFSALESMKFADFAAWSEVRFTAMIKTALTGGNDNFKGTYAVKIGLTVNGLHVEAHYPDDEIENVHKPLLRQLAKRHFASASRRTIVFQRAARRQIHADRLLGIPLSSDGGMPPIQTLPMDGFHHYNVWLEAHNLRAYKGAPETFDVDRLAQHLRQIKEGDSTAAV